MGKYRKILVAFDGSPSSANALRQAMALCQLEHASMKVLAVVPSGEVEVGPGGERDPRAEVLRQVEAFLEAARRIGTPAPSEIAAAVERGKPYERIVQVADEEGSDLIVMGRRGLRRLERMLMGSVTARVIVHSARDVLVVPRDARLALNDVVVATDGSLHGDAALEAARYFAAARQGAITAVAVAEMLPELYAEAPEVVEEIEARAVAVLDRIAAEAGPPGVRVSTRLLRGDPASEVVAYARTNGAGAIFVGSRGRSGLERLLLGSVAEKIIGLSHCPVFVAKLRGHAHLHAVPAA